MKTGCRRGQWEVYIVFFLFLYFFSLVVVSRYVKLLGY